MVIRSNARQVSKLNKLKGNTLADWALDDPEGGIAEKKNPHKNPNVNLSSHPLTDEERKANEKKMLEELKKKMKRGNEPPKK